MNLKYGLLNTKQLIELLEERDLELQACKLADAKRVQRDVVLQQMRAEDPTSVEPFLEKELQQQDVALQEKDLKLEAVSRERDEYKLAFNKVMEHRFRNRSERYISNPAQLMLDMGDTPEAEDAAAGLADAVAEAQSQADVADVIDVPAHTRVKRKVKRDESLPAHLPRREDFTCLRRQDRARSVRVACAS